MHFSLSLLLQEGCPKVIKGKCLNIQSNSTQYTFAEYPVLKSHTYTIRRSSEYCKRELKCQEAASNYLLWGKPDYVERFHSMDSYISYFSIILTKKT